MVFFRVVRHFGGGFRTVLIGSKCQLVRGRRVQLVRRHRYGGRSLRLSSKRVAGLFVSRFFYLGGTRVLFSLFVWFPIFQRGRQVSQLVTYRRIVSASQYVFFSIGQLQSVSSFWVLRPSIFNVPGLGVSHVQSIPRRNASRYQFSNAIFSSGHVRQSAIRVGVRVFWSFLLARPRPRVIRLSTIGSAQAGSLSRGVPPRMSPYFFSCHWCGYLFHGFHSSTNPSVVPLRQALSKSCLPCSFRAILLRRYVLRTPYKRRGTRLVLLLH